MRFALVFVLLLACGCMDRPAAPVAPVEKKCKCEKCTCEKCACDGDKCKCEKCPANRPGELTGHTPESRTPKRLPRGKDDCKCDKCGCGHYCSCGPDGCKCGEHCKKPK
jgi:hypothetical protein